MFFNQLRFKTGSFFFGTRFGYVKKTKFFLLFLITIHFSKPAEQILLTLTLLMEALWATVAGYK